MLLCDYEEAEPRTHAREAGTGTHSVQVCVLSSVQEVTSHCHGYCNPPERESDS